MARRTQNNASQNLIERNPNTSQFIINSIIVLLTLATLIASVILSNKGLKESQKQYKLASDQLMLATKQFKKSIEQHTIDSTVAASKEGQSNQKQKSDSTLSAKRYLVQEQRNVFQEKLNKKQLEAIQLQAQTAKKQFDAQTLANIAANNQNKPIFMLSAVSYDSLKKCGVFAFRNVGKRPATIIRTNMCSINEAHLLLNTFNDYISKVDCNEFTTATFPLPMSKWDYDQKNTLYYIGFQYVDGAYNIPQKFVKYFSWKINDDKTVSLYELTETAVTFVKHHAKLNKFNAEDR